MEVTSKTRRQQLWANTALVLGLLAMSSTAWAEPSASARETARNLMNEGAAKRTQGDLWGARERFQAANEIMHVPTTAYQLARVQSEILQLVEARATALEAASMPVQPKESPLYAVAREDAARLAAELELRIPDVTISIEPQSALSRLSIDRLAMPRAEKPFPVKLNPGTHLISVEADGFIKETQHLTLAEGEHKQLQIALKPVPTPAAAAAAQQAPAAAESDSNHLLDAQPYPAARTRGFVASAVGGVVLATGIAAGIWSAVETGKVRDLCDGDRCPEAVRSRRDTANALANIANVAVPVGLVGIGYGLFEILTHPYTEPVKHAQQARGPQLSIDPLHPGVTLRGAL